MTHPGISWVDVVVLGAVMFGGGGGLFEAPGQLKLFGTINLTAPISILYFMRQTFNG